MNNDNHNTMKRIVVNILVMIFGASFCMAQNIREAAEEQRRRDAQKQQILEEQSRRDTQQQQTTDPQRWQEQQQQPQQQNQQQQNQQQQNQQQPQASEELSVTVTAAGTLLRGANLASKFDWLQRRAESHNTYIIEVNANENIAPRTLQYSGAINITVILRGDGTNRTIRLSTNGTMFTVRSDVTFVLDNNITLLGHNGNTGSMIYVNGGTVKMNNGATITGNIISGSNTSGGGVYVNNGTFEMSGGTISGNRANRGGGVFVNRSFTMTGGVISGNSASSGGGVFVSGPFTMRGGTISGNSAGANGGGVYVQQYAGNFTKTGGTITGYNSDQNNGNAVRDGDGIIARRGHAVWYTQNRRKETSAGSNVNLNNSTADNWDQ